MIHLRKPKFAAGILAAIFFAIALGAFSFLCSAESASWQETLAKIAVQQGGRVKPFETFARETVLYVTGKQQWQKQPVAETVWEWIASPEKWTTEALIYIAPLQIRAEFGLKVINKRVSAETVMSDKEFARKVQDAVMRRQKRLALNFLDKKRIELYERAVFLGQLGGGDLPGWIPNPKDPQGAWLRFSDFGSVEPLEWMTHLPGQELEDFKKSAEDFATLFRKANATDIEKTDAAEKFKTSLDAVFSKAGIALDRALLDKEIFYNRLHAFGRGAKLYLIATLFFVLSFFVRRKREYERDYLQGVGICSYVAAILMHVLGFYLRCSISGRAPVTNMYESIIWVSLAVAVFALPISLYLRQGMVLVISSLVAAMGLLLAESFPAVLDPALSPLVPVLRSNLWLTVHVLTITMSYGAFALAWGLAHGVILGFALNKKAISEATGPRVLANAVYRAIQIGVILLAIGTVLGGVWANYSWGRFWGWDPKETWALIALLGYLVVLHGRFMGWYKSFGLAVGAIVAFTGVVMAWYGVNFVLAAGLHSYGFGGGGYPYVAAVVFADLILMAIAVQVYRSKNGKKA